MLLRLWPGGGLGAPELGLELSEPVEELLVGLLELLGPGEGRLEARRQLRAAARQRREPLLVARQLVLRGTEGRQWVKQPALKVLFY